MSARVEQVGSAGAEPTVVAAAPEDAAGTEAGLCQAGVSEAAAAEAEPAGVPVHQLRADFRDHLSTHYPRLVGQLFAVTLDSGEAHDLVQEAYSRAWRDWARIRAEGDAAAWVRRVAVRSSARSWRQVLARLGVRRSVLPGEDTTDPRTARTLRALARLDPAERRAVVLVHMSGLPVVELALLEQIPVGTAQARLRRAEQRLGSMLDDLVIPAYRDADEGSGDRPAGHAEDEGERGE